MRVDNSYTKGDGELLPATLVYQIMTNRENNFLHHNTTQDIVQKRKQHQQGKSVVNTRNFSYGDLTYNWRTYFSSKTGVDRIRLHLYK